MHAHTRTHLILQQFLVSLAGQVLLQLAVVELAASGEVRQLRPQFGNLLRTQLVHLLLVQANKEQRMWEEFTLP